MAKKYLLFDIGATKTRFAVSADGRNLRSLRIVPTPQKFDAAMKVFDLTIQGIVSGRLSAAAGGVPGPADYKQGIMLKTPNLPAWKGKPLKKTLEKIFNAKVYLENDALMSALGEANYGAGKGYRKVLYVTVSTGVNAKLIVDGKISELSGSGVGHQIIDASGPKCPHCGVRGTWESYVSGAALRRRYGKAPRDILDKKIWDEEAKWLALGIANSIRHWSPQIVVMGGGIALSGKVSLVSVNSYLKQFMRTFPAVPQVKKAILGDLGGLRGALAYLRQQK
ncbi:MAG: ROK family protein [bacterium]|nr:ROK family protein [bacterium]